MPSELMMTGSGEARGLGKRSNKCAPGTRWFVALPMTLLTPYPGGVTRWHSLMEQ